MGSGWWEVGSYCLAWTPSREVWQGSQGRRNGLKWVRREVKFQAANVSMKPLQTGRAAKHLARHLGHGRRVPANTP